MDSDLMAVIDSDCLLSNDLDVGLSINSDGATATDLTLLVTIDSARAEVGRLDARPKPREAADSEGVPALDLVPSVAMEFDADHVRCKLAEVVATGVMAIAATKAEAAVTMEAAA